MFRFLSKNTFTSKGLLNGDSTTSTMSYFLHSPFDVIARSISISTSSSTTTSNSFTVSYLIHSCGLSQQNAISVSNKFQLKDSSKPDSALTLLRNYGFTNTHISKFVFRCPELLLYDPVKNLQPKFDFLSSIGFSASDLVKLLSFHPGVLTYSLNNSIIPVCSFLKSICHSGDVVPLLKWPWILTQKHIAVNVEVLRANGVPDSNILMGIRMQPKVVCATADTFSKTVEKIKEMGFDPLRVAFLTGIRALLSMSKSGWQVKVDAYRSWGWSEEKIIKAFVKAPGCMLASYKKINCIMDFLVNKIGYDASLIAQHPHVVLYSLEKRIIPRGSVLQVLILNGLVKKNCSIGTVMSPPEKYFLKNYVTKFEKELPNLLSLYQEKLNGPKSSSV